MRPITKALLGLAVLTVLVLPGATYAKQDQASGSKPAYDHVFVIMEENTEAGGIIGNPNAPTFNSLATRYGLATNYYGVTHPSEPNYVATIGGDFFGIADDNSWQVNQLAQPSLADQLEGAGLTWKGYFQNMPTPGFEGTCYPVSPCLYASKHNPFLNFTHVATSPAEKANLVPDTQLMADLATGNLPSFAFIVPDQCHDIHGIGSTCPDKQTNVRVADDYLTTVVTAIMNSPTWNQGHNAIVVTFDEGDSALGCCNANPGGGRVVTIVATNHQHNAIVDDSPYNHYSLLATVQQAFGLGCLANTCDTANVQPMDKLFGLHPTSNKH